MLEGLVGECVAALDERSLALLGPRGVAAEGRVEAVGSRRAADYECGDVALVPEGKARGLEARVELRAQRPSSPPGRGSESGAGDVVTEQLQLGDRRLALADEPLLDDRVPCEGDAHEPHDQLPVVRRLAT